jgi:hypothetical protein
MMKKIFIMAAALPLSLGFFFAFSGVLVVAYAAQRRMMTSPGNCTTMMKTEIAATTDVSGDLTAPMTPGKPPFGGEKLGTFTITPDGDRRYRLR